MKTYFIKNHLGLIAIFVAFSVPLISIIIEINLNQDKVTKKYYFAESYDVFQKEKPTDTIKCWTRSVMSNRTDAFRCMTEDSFIYDPCFYDPFSREIVVCPISSSGENKYFKVNIEKDVLDEPINKTESIPWLIKLSNDKECRFVSGATLVLADMRMDYICDGSETDNFLLLPMSSNNDLNQISCMSRGKIDKCDIKEVWY